MDIYSNGVHFRDIQDKKGSKVRVFYTENGSEPWTKSKIYKRIVELGPENYRTAFNEFVNNIKAIPRGEEVLLWIVLKEFYPTLMVSNNIDKSTVDRWMDMIREEIVIPIAIRFGTRKTRKGSRTKEDKIVDEHTCCMFNLLGSAVYIGNGDGHFYHIFDKRVEVNQEMTRKIETNIFSHKRTARFSALRGIRAAFECDIRKATEFEFDPMDLVEITDWYIKKTELFGDSESAVELARFLNEKSKNDADKDIVLAVYEDNQKELDKVFMSHPKLDFIDRGRFEEFESGRAIGVAVGVDVAEFFVEPADTGKEATSTGPKSNSKRDVKAYSLEIINEIDKLHDALKPLSEQTKIFNIKPNSVKKRKASVFGKYIAVAAKIDDEWIILVDSIKPDSAVYCWHGKRYLDGLEVFKASRTYAREQPCVDHNNHRFDKKPIEIYKKLLKKRGIVL